MNRLNYGFNGRQRRFLLAEDIKRLVRNSYSFSFSQEKFDYHKYWIGTETSCDGDTIELCPEESDGEGLAKLKRFGKRVMKMYGLVEYSGIYTHGSQLERRNSGGYISLNKKTFFLDDVERYFLKFTIPAIMIEWNDLHIDLSCNIRCVCCDKEIQTDDKYTVFNIDRGERIEAICYSCEEHSSIQNRKLAFIHTEYDDFSVSTPEFISHIVKKRQYNTSEGIINNKE
jgi:hypothetical protein